CRYSDIYSCALSRKGEYMIRFSKYMWVYFFISSLVIIPGVYSLIRFGLRPAIDFTGGTLVEMKFEKDVPDNIFIGESKKLQISLASIQKTSTNTYLLRIKDGSEKVADLSRGLSDRTGQKSDVIRNETVGPVLGKE